KPRAYERAAHAVEALGQPLSAVHAEGGAKALTKVPGIGKGIAERIDELLSTGACRELQALREAMPSDIMALTAIEGIGPKMVKALYDDLGVRTVDDLAQAARAGRVRALAHFGEKTEARILKGLDLLAARGGRRPLGLVLGLARDLEARLADLSGV